MIYETAQDWRNAPRKSVLLFAMSGLGKTHVSSILAQSREWFHYSIDYRIGTRYMAEPIADNLKREAMKVPFLAEMLRQDAIHIGANVHDHDLTAVSAYLGKPGDPGRGGLPMAEYRKRQAQFREAEERALMDTAHFMDRAQTVYGYPHFICDTGGSICEWVNAEDPNDPILTSLSQSCLMIWIEGGEEHIDALVQRFDKAPKPMAYQPQFLETCWEEYLQEFNGSAADVDPDSFIRWTYRRALDHRQPRYAAMARNWGLTVSAADIATVRDGADFDAIVATALERWVKDA